VDKRGGHPVSSRGFAPDRMLDVVCGSLEKIKDALTTPLGGRMEMMVSIYLWWLGRNISQVENREGVVGSQLGEGDQ
jgi:hypothetical protein